MGSCGLSHLLWWYVTCKIISAVVTAVLNAFFDVATGRVIFHDVDGQVGRFLLQPLWLPADSVFDSIHSRAVFKRKLNAGGRVHSIPIPLEVIPPSPVGGPFSRP